MKTAKYKQFVGGLIIGIITMVLAGYIVNGSEFLIVFCRDFLERGLKITILYHHLPVKSHSVRENQEIRLMSY